MRELLIETMPVSFQILEESTHKNGGRMKVKGIFASADEVNANNRVYPDFPNGFSPFFEKLDVPVGVKSVH